MVSFGAHDDRPVLLFALFTSDYFSPFSWAHRKYILWRVLDATMTTSLLDVFRSEVKVCHEIAGRYPKNYYAWTHRRYCLGIVIQSIDLHREEKMKLLGDEWDDIVTEWLPKNVSDHSAAHYAAQVLELWLHQLQSQQIKASELQNFVAEILNGVKVLVEGEEPHETLWILLRMVVTILLKHTNSLDDLIVKEVNSVAKDYMVTSTSELTTGFTDNVHALTCLLWVAMFTSTSTGTPILLTKRDMLKVLARHPNIHHCMWTEGYQETE
jgi:hypothetical protein